MMIKRPTPPTKSGVPPLKSTVTINYDIIAGNHLPEAEAVIAFILKSHEGNNIDININVKDIEADKVFKKNRNVADKDILEISDKFIISGIVTNLEKGEIGEDTDVITIDCGNKTYQIYYYCDGNFNEVKLNDYIRCYIHLLKIFDGNDYLYRAISYFPKDIIEIIHNKRLAQE